MKKIFVIFILLISSFTSVFAQSNENILSGHNEAFTNSMASNISLFVENKNLSIISLNTTDKTLVLSKVKENKELADKQGITYKILGIIWPDNTNNSQSKDDYKEYIKNIQKEYEDEIRKITNQSEAVVLMLEQSLPKQILTKNGFINSSTSLAQFEAYDETPGKILLVTPKYFLNNVSLNTDELLGQYYAKVYKYAVIDQRAWIPLSPRRITIMNDKARIVFDVPVGNLEFDTMNIPMTRNYGFQYTDYEGPNSAKISDVKIASRSTVIISFDRKPTGSNQKINYAYDLLSGNLRDQDTLPNWAMQFEKQIVDNQFDYDVNLDGKKDADDLSMFLSKYQSTQEADIINYDFDYDNVISSSDLSLLILKIFGE